MRPELRQDPCTRDWLVIAPRRSERPHPLLSRVNETSESQNCSFCRGHEAETPPEIWRMDGPDGGWQVRVVPNRFPMFVPDGRPRRHVEGGGFVSLPAVVRHEVVIESPDHNADLARADVSAVRAVLEAYRARYVALRESGCAIVLIFRNHGAAAGTSLAHPHSQIVAAPVVPIQIRHRFEVAMQHYDDVGACLYTDILDRELRDGRRIVVQGSRFVAFQPFASVAPFETWIIPRSPQPSFGDASDADLDELAPVMRAVLGGLADVLDDPDYNAVFQSAPVNDEHREYFVWHLRIVPRLAVAAGFELGTGMPVSPALPEQTAATLRPRVLAELNASSNPGQP